MKTIIKVMESLVALNKWTVVRFDLQRFEHCGKIEGYCAYLEVKEMHNVLRIHDNGGFEVVED